MNKVLRESIRMRELRLREHLREMGIFDEYDVYSFEALSSLSEDDEITGAEEGFMLGYMNA